MRPLQPDSPLITNDSRRAIPFSPTTSYIFAFPTFFIDPQTCTEIPPPPPLQHDPPKRPPAMQRVVRLLLLSAMLVAVTQVSSVGEVRKRTVHA